MLSDLLLPVLHNALRPVDGVQRGSFSPRGLFLAGEQGGWWDPSDFTTMFQDSAGTTPVTAVGQPVGLIRDKSGRANHRTQATAASRPTLQQDGSGFFHLLYDGVDDFMQTASMDFSTTDKVLVVCGATKSSDASLPGCLIELSVASGSNNGTFAIFAPGSSAGQYSGRSKGTASSDPSTVSGAFPAPDSGVITLQGDIGNDGAILRRNAVQIASAVTDQGTGNFGNYPAFFGRRGGTTSPFTGREYQTIIRGTASTAAQIAQSERFAGSKMGIAL